MAHKRRSLKYLTASALFAAVVLLSQSGVAQKKDSGFVVDKIIVRVDDKILLKSDLENTYQQYLTAGNTPSEREKCALLSRLVINKLLVAKAEIDSVLVTDAEVDNNTDQRMGALLANDGNSAEELEKHWGKTLAEIKQDLREQIREQMLGQEMTSRITKEVTITPSEVKRFIGKVPVDSLPFYSSDVEVAQIVRVAKVSTAQKEKAKQRLTEIRDELIKGGDFNTLAKKYSEDPTAQHNGGELGKVGRGAMLPEYEAVAFRMKAGEISMPFSTMYGFHIMQLIERTGNEYTSRHILIAATPSAEDLKSAEHYLDSLRRKILKDSIKFGEAAKFYSDDKATKDHGGFLTDQSGGTKVSLDPQERIIDFPLYQALEQLKIGEISQPLPYRTDDGKDAVRILFKKSQVKAHKANLTDDWFRLQAGALNEKKDKTLEKWFQKAKSDVYISIDPFYKGCKILD